MPDSSAVWAKTKTGGKAGFDKLWAWADKLGAPVNRLSNKLGSEAFWPTTLDKESDKAARILKSFCKDGFYTEEEVQSAEGVPQGKQRVVKKIPSEVIQKAKGLCIFTTMRTGLWVSGSGGSGVLVARMPDGEWSPPSGILMHTAGLGFLVGVDIYDCVIVINSEKALDAFTKVRCTLGGEMSATAGPVGMGGVIDSEVHKRQSPIFTYLKSRGFYAGVQIDGTIIIERTDENERFYNQKIPVSDILKGKVRHAPYETRTLMATLNAAEGQQVDEELLPEGPPPGDYEIEEDGHMFGIPDKEDPDPYGVLALQKEGMEIREAGSQERPSHEEFKFEPSPSSPVHNIINRRSLDSKDLNGVGNSRRASWRTSALSTTSKMTDTATQTDEEDLAQRSPYSATFADRPSRRDSNSPASSAGHLQGIPETNTAHKAISAVPPPLPPRAQALSPPPEPEKIQDEEEDADNEDGDDGAIIERVHTASMPTTPIGAVQISKPRLVTVHKVAPPRLPPRSAARERKPPSEDGADATEVHAPASPLSSVGVERKAEENSESEVRAESLSSFSDARASPAEAVENKKPADGFQDVDLGKDSLMTEKPETLPTMEKPRDHGFEEVDLNKPSLAQEVKKEATEEEKRLSSEVIRNFAAQMRMDGDDDDDDDDIQKKTPGAW